MLIGTEVDIKRSLQILPPKQLPLPWWAGIKGRGTILVFTRPLPLPSREGWVDGHFYEAVKRQRLFLLSILLLFFQPSIPNRLPP